jgi:hypothetical protein
MTELVVKAAYGSVVEDEGQLFIGFAEGEDDDEGYVLFRQAIGGGPVWFEVSDEALGAEDAVQQVVAGPDGFQVLIRPAKQSAFAFATAVTVEIGPDCEDAEAALAALQDMLDTVWVGAKA